ncbi:DUF1771-domain-containing protein [Auriscalpium vulgare]|uniref:DUF1771-domain-containing protein n=1 Tax=Auriscalpium vulgare TaxID=40419 RepID=A0ACB8S5P9_9AGAM|nr:DUF1771-domain-containing protein [Auriscalpium vulgare]
MGILGDILRALGNVLCGQSSSQQPQEPQGQGYPGKPTYAQQTQPQQQQQQGYNPPQQQQQQPSYYPPQQQQQQQYHPPQQQQQPQQQQPWGAQQPQPVQHHKPHHGHGQGPAPFSTPPTSPPHPASPPPHGRPHGRVDQNQVNQANEHYTSLRARANVEGDAMGRAFDESHTAYERGDGARAKELSNEGKAHQREMERLNAEASEWIFRENNTDSGPGEVDLHGLYVKEAITYTDRAIQEARQRGESELHLIVGKGLHSANHNAKIKPAIEELMLKHNLVAALDPQNSGVLIVQLDGGSAGERTRERGGQLLGADDITRRLGDARGDGCVIM